MPRNQETVELVQGGWTEITNGDASVISLQLLNGEAEIRGTTDAAPPAANARGWRLTAGDFALARPLSELFSAVGIRRVWGRALRDPRVEVQVDHADV